MVFLGLTNFYCRFIKNFSKIKAPLTSILKIIELADASTSILIGTNVDKFISGDSSLEPMLSKFKKTKWSKSQILAESKNHTNVKAMNFFISKANIAFTFLKKVFTKISIF